MKFIWEAGDIVCGLRVVQPQKGTLAVIGWVGSSGDGVTLSETNTDGMIHYQHETDDEGQLVKVDGKLIQVFFTQEQLAERMNTSSYQWVPAAMFSGSGERLKWGKAGKLRDSMNGLKDLELLA